MANPLCNTKAGLHAGIGHSQDMTRTSDSGKKLAKFVRSIGEKTFQIKLK